MTGEAVNGDSVGVTDGVAVGTAEGEEVGEMLGTLVMGEKEGAALAGRK